MARVSGKQNGFSRHMSEPSSRWPTYITALVALVTLVVLLVNTAVSSQRQLREIVEATAKATEEVAALAIRTHDDSGSAHPQLRQAIADNAATVKQVHDQQILNTQQLVQIVQQLREINEKLDKLNGGP